MNAPIRAERLRTLAADRSGDGPSGARYDPELLHTLNGAADHIDRLHEVVEAARGHWHECDSCDPQEDCPLCEALTTLDAKEKS